MEKVADGFVVNYGGINVTVARIDHPLVYDGPVPTVELVGLDIEEMTTLGVNPGDPAPGSTTLEKRFYVLKGASSDITESAAMEEEQPSKGFPGNPEINPEDNSWFNEVGSSLAFGSDSGISINGCADVSFWDWLWSSSLKDRRGEACFYGSFTDNEECIDVLFPAWPCPLTWTRTTIYSKIYELLGWYLWLVYEPEVWVNVGEDGWDDITLMGDKRATEYPFEIASVVVEHNDMAITDSTHYSPWVTLHGPPDSFELADDIYDYKRSLVFDSTHSVVLAAVGDYAQAASFKYPVFPHPDPWSWTGGDLPPGTSITVPHLWCTEFASWAYRQGGYNAGYDGFNDLPMATPGNDDIGIQYFWDWTEGKDRNLLVFGRDELLHPEYVNGPTSEEWAELATLVKEGDYLARWEEQPDPTPDRAHSMIVVGWLDEDGSSIGSSNFDSKRSCNPLLVVDGNMGGLHISEAKGLGTVVKVSRHVICRPEEDGNGYSIDPDCDINGNDIPNESDEECTVRLWDTDADGIPSRSSFFVDMNMEQE